MKDKIEMSEVNVSSFIREMTTLIDSHEISGAFSEIMNDDFMMLR
jgi:hypothetical protein